MSFFTHHSRHSWPPYETPPKHPRPGNDRKSEDLSIDENPFSFFISPPAGDDRESDEDYFSAGIDSKPTPPRSPFLCSRTNESLSVTEGAKSPAAVLRRWIKYMEARHPHLSHRRQVEEAPPKPVVPLIVPSDNSAERGREADRSAETIRGRKQVRSHSGRPRSWREPSADLWPVSEGYEGVEETRTNRTGDESRMNSPPPRARRIRFVEDVV